MAVFMCHSLSIIKKKHIVLFVCDRSKVSCLFGVVALSWALFPIFLPYSSAWMAMARIWQFKKRKTLTPHREPFVKAIDTLRVTRSRLIIVNRIKCVFVITEATRMKLKRTKQKTQQQSGHHMCVNVLSVSAVGVRSELFARNILWGAASVCATAIATICRLKHNIDFTVSHTLQYT